MTRIAWLACRAEARAQVRDACKIGEGATMTTRRECSRLPVRSEVQGALAYSLLPAWDWLACPLDIRYRVRGEGVRMVARVREMSKGGCEVTVERMARDYKAGATEMLHASGYRAIVARSHAAEWLYRAPDAKGTLAPDVWETLERGANEIDKAEDLFLSSSPAAREAAQAWAEESQALAVEWEDIPAAMTAWAAYAVAVDELRV